MVENFFSNVSLKILFRGVALIVQAILQIIPFPISNMFYSPQ